MFYTAPAIRLAMSSSSTPTSASASSADVLFQGSIGRTDFPRGDHDALIDAIKTKLLPSDDNFFFICGHGPASSIGHERQHNPFLR